MREVTLLAEPRPEKGSPAARRLRRSGKVPAVVYGLESDPVSVAVSAQEMMHVLHRVGVNALINLEVDGGEGLLTMAREVQRHPIKGELVHIDFVRIHADIPVQADIAVHLTGEPKGAKEGGVLEQALFTVTVSAKPRELPSNFEIDVSDLAMGDSHRVADLEIPAGVEILTDPEAVVANCLVPRVAEEAPLSAEELAMLEGLSEEELAALKELARAKAADEGEGEEGEGGEEAGDGEGAGEGADGASEESSGDE